MKRFPRIQVAVMGLLSFVLSIFTGPARVMSPPVFVGNRATRRAITHDVAFGFRMGGGFPGDVNRMHPASIVPGLLDPTNNFLGYGQVALFGDGTTGANNTYRALVAADGSATAIKAAGLIVRPYPTQQMAATSLNAPIGSAVPPTSGIADFLHAGFMIVKMKAGTTVKKGGAVHVWVAATSGANIQGEFAAAASTTNTVTLANARYTGPADANGNVEIEIWEAV